jgi:hypothetical protein
MGNIKKFKEFDKIQESNIGDFIQDGKFMIIEIIDPKDDPEIPNYYIEFVAYGVDDGKFYLLDPDYEIIEGPHNSIEDLYYEIGIEEIPNFNPPNSKT